MPDTTTPPPEREPWSPPSDPAVAAWADRWAITSPEDTHAVLADAFARDDIVAALAGLMNDTRRHLRSKEDA